MKRFNIMVHFSLGDHPQSEAQENSTMGKIFRVQSTEAISGSRRRVKPHAESR